jgi:hypothetical protein
MVLQIFDSSSGEEDESDFGFFFCIKIVSIPPWPIVSVVAVVPVRGISRWGPAGICSRPHAVPVSFGKKANAAKKASTAAFAGRFRPIDAASGIHLGP